MDDGSKYLLRCVGLYIITVVVFLSGVEFGTPLPVMFVMCMWLFEILQIVNLVKGIRNYRSGKWNVVSLVLFIIVSLVYIVFCGWYFTVMSVVFAFGLEGIRTR